MSVILEVEDLQKSYGGWRLSDLSFTLDAGRIAALTGHNGSGKSTVLRCVAGLAAYEGRVRVSGHEVREGVDARRHLAYVPQSVQLPATATIGETLSLFAAFRSARVADLPLPDGFLRPYDTRIGTLSGGHRQRVALAAALLGNPALLLLDEPVANLDTEGRAAFWDAMESMRDRGTTALIAAPALSTGIEGADLTFELHEGRLASATPVLRSVENHPVGPIPLPIKEADR